MRRDRFVAVLYSCIPAMRRCIRKHRLDPDTVSDLVSDTITDTLAKKKYAQIKTDCKAFLCRQTAYNAQEYKRQLTQRGKNMLHLVDDVSELERFYEDTDDTEDTEKTCPFCHVALLNQYGACAHCHTILANRIRRGKELWRELEDLSVDFQYEKKSDVRKAVDRLPPLQQKIVRAIIMGNETVGEFVSESGYSAATIWREWRKAKLELTSYLADYSVHRLSTHTKMDLQAALN